MDKRNRQEMEARLNALNQLLRGCDYIGTKIATGRATASEYASQIAQMNTWAQEINALEAQLAEL